MVTALAFLQVFARLRCRLGWCGGHVVSGTHDNVIWIGWQCDACGIVKYYEPSKWL
jgi:hypothetical protein